MDWGFLVGFTLGSIILFAYHMVYLYKMCTSNKMKFVYARSEMFQTMIEFGEIVEVRKENDSGN